MPLKSVLKISILGGTAIQQKEAVQEQGRELESERKGSNPLEELGKTIAELQVSMEAEARCRWSWLWPWSARSEKTWCTTATC